MRALRTFGPAANAEQFRVVDSMLDIEDYLGRDGYNPGFIDRQNPLPLPVPGHGWRGDIVPLLDKAKEPGRDDFEIRYTHFSVKMCISRKLPFFSACNIDGKQSDREVERTDVWRRDPRIDTSVQIHRQGYGHDHQGLFARGHMTRREDPNWGDTAQQADIDTFTIPNVAPQRQRFNAGIWLALEDYVLNSADRENIKVSVMTGPVLSDDDPVYYGIKVPITFWKIIAYVNGQTRELTTLGYTRTQLEYLPRALRSRFVFGDFDDTQVSIASIQEDTGLDFGNWTEFDVMKGADSRMAVRLTSVSDLYLRP